MLTPDEIARMHGGTRRQRRELARQVQVIVEKAVSKLVRRSSPEFYDSVADQLEKLFDDDARLLRRWDPQRATLKYYITLIVTRSLWRKLQRPVVLQAFDDLGLPYPGDGHEHIEAVLVYRAALEELLEWLYHHGTDSDTSRFEALFLEGCSTKELARREDLSVDAIYAWVSRFRRRAAKALPHTMVLLRRVRPEDEDEDEIDRDDEDEDESPC